MRDRQIADAVLVGHGYGGVVVTGAADRVPECVAGLVCVDAVVPQDGDSCWSLVTDQERAWRLGPGGRPQPDAGRPRGAAEGPAGEARATGPASGPGHGDHPQRPPRKWPSVRSYRLRVLSVTDGDIGTAPWRP
ncbi:hypothetical protein AB0B78_09975 [Streptomyces sp. NPDC040724]|uniref:hypothetical protein n=1 Tax=Streptomyces sp. NPDC040724 TaxID=3155612 RepID=UPI003406B623